MAKSVWQKGLDGPICNIILSAQALLPDALRCCVHLAHFFFLHQSEGRVTLIIILMQFLNCAVGACETISAEL